MTSYRRALSTAFYVCAIVCMLVAIVLWVNVSPGTFVVALLAVAGIASLILAISFDERL